MVTRNPSAVPPAAAACSEKAKKEENQSQPMHFTTNECHLALAKIARESKSIMRTLKRVYWSDKLVTLGLAQFRHEYPRNSEKREMESLDTIMSRLTSAHGMDMASNSPKREMWMCWAKDKRDVVFTNNYREVGFQRKNLSAALRARPTHAKFSMRKKRNSPPCSSSCLEI
jgi:hypothetical protein